MADGLLIAIELKEQGEIHRLDIRVGLHQHTVVVLQLLEDLLAEPLRNQRDLQVTGVTVVGLMLEYK